MNDNATVAESVEANHQDNNQGTIAQLDVNSEQVTQLYNYIFKDKDTLLIADDKYLYYTKNKITYDDLSDYNKFLTVVTNCDDSEKTALSGSSIFDRTTFEETKDVTENEYLKNYDLNKYRLIFWENKYNIDIIEKKLHQIFGPSASMHFSNFTKDCSNYTGFCLYRNGAYECGRWNGGTKTAYITMTKLVSAEMDGNNIYLYDKHVLVEEMNSKSQNIADNTFNIYNTSDKSDLVERGISFDDFYKNKNYANSIDNIENDYGSAIKTFKHTFKKDVTGNYYWISSEMVQ